MWKTVVEVIWDVFALIGGAVVIGIIGIAIKELFDWLKRNCFTLSQRDARRRRVIRMIKRKMRTGEIIMFDQYQEIKWAYAADEVLRNRLRGVEDLLTSLHAAEDMEDECE